MADITTSTIKIDNGASTVNGNLTVTGNIIKSGGTSSQFLKADGSVDSSSFLRSDVNDYASGKVFFTYHTASEPYAAVEINGGTTHTGLYINPSASSQAHVRFGTNGTLKWQIRAPFQDSADADLKIYSWVSADDMFYFKHTGALGFKKSTGTIISTGGGADAFGYNASYGHYIQGTGSRYIYGDGIYYDGAVARSLIHSGNIGSQSVASAGNADTLDSLDSSQFLRSDQSDTMTGTLTVNSSGIASSFTSGAGGYSSIRFLSTGGGAVGSLTTTSSVILIGSENTPGTGSNGEIIIEPNVGNVLYLKAGGNIGISNSSPRYKIDLASANAEFQTDYIAMGVRNGPSTGDGNDLGNGLIFKVDYASYSKRSAGIVQIAEGNYFRSGLGFFTNGTSDASTDWVEAMRITQNQRIGLGTNAPNEKLDVRGNVRISRDGVNDSGILAFGNYSGASGYFDNGIFRSALNQPLVTGNILHIASYEALAFTAGAAAFGSQTIRMYIKGSNGHVGIGETNPDEKLHVIGNVSISDSAKFESSSANPIIIGDGFGTGGSATIHKYQASLYLQYNNGSATTDLHIGGGGTQADLRLDTGGGRMVMNRDDKTGSAIEIDHVENSTWAFDFRTSSVGNDNDSGFWVNSDGTPDMRLRGDGPTVKVLVHSNGDSYFNGGNVGFGVTNPTAPLEVLNTSSQWGVVNRQVRSATQKNVGYAGDYNQHVILLHRIYDGTLIDFQYVAGKIYATRGAAFAGLINDEYEINSASAYSSDTYNLQSKNGIGQLYVCYYGGVKYLALIPKYRVSAVGYMFDGYYVSDSNPLTLVNYRNSNTGEILNSEIYNSLTLVPTNTSSNIDGNLYVNKYVGIGETNPTAPMVLSTPGNTVDGTFYSTFTIKNTGATSFSRIRFDSGSIAKWGLTHHQDDSFRISNLYKNGAVAADDDAFAIKNTSYIGIGTGSPITKTHIQNSAVVNDAYGLLYVENTFSADASGTSNSAVNVKNHFGTSQFMQWQNAGLRIGSRILTNGGAGDVYFTSGADSVGMVLKANGYLGVGNTLPTARVDAAGVRIGRDFSLSGRSTVRIDSNGTGNPADILFGHTAAANESSWTGVYWSISSRAAADGDKLHFYRGSGNATSPSESIIMTIAPQARVGILNSAPQYTLHVGGDAQISDINFETGGYHGIRFQDGGTNKFKWGHDKGANQFYIYDYTKNASIFTATGNGNVSFTQTGNFGVNVTSPLDKLHVVGGILVENGAGSGIIRGGVNDAYHGMTFRGYPNAKDTTAMTAADVMSFWEYGGDFRFYQKGAVFNMIGRLNGGTLTVSGDVIAYGSPSDRSLKENIKPIEGALDKVKKLKGVTFDWKQKDDQILNIKEDYGFIAQEVQEVIPELVRMNDNGKLSLRDKGIVAVLVEAIKDQQKQIDELKSMINGGSK